MSHMWSRRHCQKGGPLRGVREVFEARVQGASDQEAIETVSLQRWVRLVKWGNLSQQGYRIPENTIVSARGRMLAGAPTNVRFVMREPKGRRTDRGVGLVAEALGKNG